MALVSVALAAVGLFIAAIPAEFAQLRVPCPAAPCPTVQLPPSGLRALEDLDLSLDTFAAYSVVMDVVFAAAYVAVAALIFWRKSEDRMGLFVSLALLTFGNATFSSTMAALAARYPAWEMPVSFFHFLGSACFGLFLYLFPDGRFVPRWTRWVALVWLAWQLPRYLFPEWYLDPRSWHAVATMAVWVGALGTIVYSQVHAKIGKAAAERAALEAVPGTVHETEPETNDGGYVVYDIEIAGEDGKNHEVTVDAGDGEVLYQEHEDETDDSDWPYSPRLVEGGRPRKSFLVSSCVASLGQRDGTPIGKLRKMLQGISSQYAREGKQAAQAPARPTRAAGGGAARPELPRRRSRPAALSALGSSAFVALDTPRRQLVRSRSKIS